MDIRVKQLDTTDCGAACLASVARHYDLDVPVALARLKAGTDKTGTSVRGLMDAAESFGFEAKAVRGTFRNLPKVPLPAIAHIVISATLHHYVVIAKVTSKHVVVMDPTDGEFHNKSHRDFKNQWEGILLLIVPGNDFEPGVFKKRSVIGRLWTFIWPHRKVLMQALFGALVYTILGLSTSVFIQKIVDHVITEGNYTLLNLMGIVMIILLLLRVVINVFKNIFILRTGQLIDARLILGYYKHLLKLPQQFFDSMRVGEITSRLNDAVKIRLFINDVSINLIVSILMLLSSLALMFTYYWKLALMMLLVIPAYSLIYYITNRLNKRWQRQLMENAAQLESQLVESLNAMGTIKRLGLEAYSNAKTESKFVGLLKSVYKSGLNSLYSGAFTEFTSQLFTILLLWFGAGYTLRQQISPGELLSFYTLMGYFTGPVSTFVGMNKTVQDALIASDRLFNIMDVEREPQASHDMIELSFANIGDIRFSNVSYRYANRENIFSNLSLEIPFGKMTGIVGESGCGKSTLISLLHNIYPICGGDIFIGHHSLKYMSNKSLRRVIGVVPQTIDLFSGSVLLNIALGDETPEMEKVLRICNKLGIMSFIEGLPGGFETNVGENGVALSGGQKQRIAIARALYRNPEILVLDEATSSLDPSSERYVQETISDFISRGKTAIIIAHRLSTIRNADKIIVLQDGQLKEEGTHDELIVLKAAYHGLWSKSLSSGIDNS